MSNPLGSFFGSSARMGVKCIVSIAATIHVAICEGTSAVDITYKVKPLTLSEGYAIDGGFITTNGTLGPLQESDIQDYEIRVSGPGFPFVFNPTNQSVFIARAVVQFLQVMDKLLLHQS